MTDTPLDENAAVSSAAVNRAAVNPTTGESVADEPQAKAPRWQPIASLDRRVLGVLGEKAKTTPDAYPMTLNAIKTGCNQKNNRYPLMEIEVDDVEEALERLRGLGAVAEIHGDGRVNKYRHLLYDWLGVSKVEMAVMVELLLRGAQTEGELRGRAVRMEPIADLGALRPVLASLKAKNLIVSLTPEGRGHALTHALYEPRELEKVRRDYQPTSAAGDPNESAATPPPQRPAAAHSAHAAHAAPSPSGASASSSSPGPPRRDQTGAGPSEAVLASLVSAMETLRSEVADLRADLARTQNELEDLASQLR